MRVGVHAEVEKFIRELDAPTVAKALRTIDLLEKFGSDLRLPHSRPVGKGLFELRIRGQQEVRILYVFHGNAAVLLHGFMKKSAQTPRKEFEVGFDRMKRLT